MNRKLYFILCFTFFTISIKSQTFLDITFDKLPQNLQLYPRNNENKSTILIKGFTTNSDIKYISVLIKRNNDFYDYKVQSIINVNNNGQFELYTSIHSELAEYQFDIYKKSSETDSVLIVSRSNIVSGDAYLINGQSNSYNGLYNADASGFNSQLYRGEYARSFGVFTQPDNYGVYNPADTLWNYSNINNVVGMWGTELQKLIIEKYQIPVCIINGGSGGSSCEYNAFRNSQNPMDFNTSYGRLLYKTIKSGLINHIKAYLYRQGENEAFGAALSWKGKFEELYSNLKLDYPSIQKYYIFQNNVYNFQLYTAGILRDDQRKLQEIHSDLRAIATVGTIEFDGVHYGTNGYIQSANEIFRLIDFDFYGRNNSQNIFSPNINKVFYNIEKSKIILVFDEGQDMVYPEPNYPNWYTYTDILQFLSLNISSNYTSQGYADHNRIILNVGDTFNSNALTYLPPYLAENSPNHPLIKPVLINKLGMRAFSFSGFPISSALNTPIITYSFQNNKTIINWNTISNASDYIIERKKSIDEDYVNIAKISPKVGQNQEFVDGEILPNDQYNYRVRAINNITESEYSNVINVNFIFVHCSSVYVIKNGLWSDPSIWSCNHIPIATDDAHIDGFTVSITGNCIAKNVYFANGGNIVFTDSGNLELAGN